MVASMGTARSGRTLRLVGAAFALVATSLLVDACVIADPPTPLPQVPDGPPTILHSSVVPSTSSVLATWPTTFIVPVQLSNPRADVAWASFVDFNPVTGEGFDNSQVSRWEPTQNGIRVLEIPITMPSLDRCHVVEIVVALRLNTSSTQTAHTPEPPGGDIVTWFFSPFGDLAGCPVLDAGLLPLVDAGAGDGDAAEAGSIER